MTNQNQTAAPSVAEPTAHALDFTRRNDAYQQGAQWAEAQRSTYEVVSNAARTLGTNPTHEEWTEYAAQWKDGYVHQNPNNTANAGDQQWARFAKQLGEFFGLTKPKAQTAHAEKKANERAAKNEKLLAKYEGKAAADLEAMRRAALEAAAKGSESAEKIAADLKKVIKLKTSEENKGIAEARKALRDKVVEAARKCTALDKLEAALDCLSDESEINFVYED